MYRAHDVWGSEVEVSNLETELGTVQSFAIGDWPIILDGVDLYAARWRMGLQILTKQIDVVVGKQEEIEFQIDNPFPFAISGKARVVCSALVGERRR